MARSLFGSKLTPFTRFLLIGGLLFVGWQLLYRYYLHPHTDLDLVIINNLIGIAHGMLGAVGYQTLPILPDDISYRIAGIDGSTGVWVGDACNGFDLFATFAIFVLAYPGNWLRRAWFIPLGLATIHFINAMRVAALAMVQFHAPHLLDFNHTYTFTILVYAWVFLLWFVWTRINGYSPDKKQSAKSHAFSI